MIAARHKRRRGPIFAFLGRGYRAGAAQAAGSRLSYFETEECYSSQKIWDLGVDEEISKPESGCSGPPPRPTPKAREDNEALATRKFINGIVQPEGSIHAPRPIQKTSERHQRPSLV